MTITTDRQKVLDFSHAVLLHAGPDGRQHGVGHHDARRAGRQDRVRRRGHDLPRLAERQRSTSAPLSPTTTPPAGVKATTLKTDADCPQTVEGRPQRLRGLAELEHDGRRRDQGRAAADQGRRPGLLRAARASPSTRAARTRRTSSPRSTQIVDDMHADGTLTAMSEKWFGARPHGGADAVGCDPTLSLSGGADRTPPRSLSGRADVHGIAERTDLRATGRRRRRRTPVVEAIAASRARARRRLPARSSSSPGSSSSAAWSIAIASTGRVDPAFIGEWAPFILGGVSITIFVSVMLDHLRDAVRDHRRPRPAVAERADLRRRDALRLARPRHAADRPDPVHLPRAAAVRHRAVRRLVVRRSSRSSFNYGAYMTEIFRAGIQAIPRGQVEAAQALGMTERLDDAPDRAPAGDPDRHPGDRQRVHLDDQGLGAGRRSSACRRSSGGRSTVGLGQLPELRDAACVAALIYWVLTIVLLARPGAAREAHGAKATSDGSDGTACAIPADPGSVSCRDPFARPGRSPRPAPRPIVRALGLREVLRQQPRAARRARSRSTRARRLPHRQVGVRQEHAAALHQLPRGAHDGRRSRSTGCGSTPTRSTPATAATASRSARSGCAPRWCSRSSTCSRTCASSTT